MLINQSYLKKLNLSLIFLSYLTIFTIIFFTFKGTVSSDTIALVDGSNQLLKCLQNTPIITPCDGALHFPLFQYLIAIPQKLINLSNELILQNFIYMSLVSSLISVILVFITGYKVSNLYGANLCVLIFLSGFVICFSDWSFNEASAFMLFCLLTFSLIFQKNLYIISSLVFLCTITKEISPPIIFLFLIIGFIANKKILMHELLYLKTTFNFIKLNMLPFFALIMGVVANTLFNVLRYSSPFNLSNLNPILHTPNEFIFKYFSILFISPSAGLLFTWFSISFLIIFFFFFGLLKRKYNNDYRFFIFLISIFVLILTNLMLSNWFSPFGMVAWGPRLTLPYLGGILIILIYSCFSYINELKTIKGKIFNFVFVFVLIISSIPNLAFRINSNMFYEKLMIETEVQKKYKRPFTIQTAPGNTYFKMTVEAASRNSIIPISIQVVSKNKVLFILWSLSFLILFGASLQNKKYKERFFNPLVSNTTRAFGR